MLFCETKNKHKGKFLRVGFVAFITAFRRGFSRLARFDLARLVHKRTCLSKQGGQKRRKNLRKAVDFISILVLPQDQFRQISPKHHCHT